MTPGERMRWANHEILRHRIAVLDAKDALAEMAMEWHYARFIHIAASEECPTCHAPAGAYCALWRSKETGEVTAVPPDAWRQATVLALFLHPARTTTPEALEAAQ